MRSLSDLIPKIVAATEKGKLTWNNAAGSGYVLSMGDNEIRTWQWTDPASEETTGITVQLVDGVTVLDDIVTTEYGAKYEQARDLYSAARRSANKVDGIIGKL